jgi:bifunctional DNase/RNase
MQEINDHDREKNGKNEKSSMLEAEIWSISQTDQGNVVLLRPLGDDMVIPIFIGPLEIQSILIGFDHIQTERPLTHDVFLDLMKKTGYAMLKAEVVKLKNNIFYSSLYFHHPGQPAPLVLDARPSDALALAVRTGCPILVSRQVRNQTGIMPDILAGASKFAPDGQEPPARPAYTEPGGESLQGLKQALEQALLAEDYERAAKIRDTLAILAKGAKGRDKPV